MKYSKGQFVLRIDREKMKLLIQKGPAEKQPLEQEKSILPFFQKPNA